VNIPNAVATRIAARANREGWNEVFGRIVAASDVHDALREGTHEYESFASFVLQEADVYGFAS
jgi:hypothetical protein